MTEKRNMAKDQKNADQNRKLAPMSGGAPDSCIEIDAEEFSAARKDPAVHRLLDRADRYADSLRSQGRLNSLSR